MSNNQQLVTANDVELCVETFGHPDDPAILLIHGACASMLWWQEELCARIAARGRYVIRYDNRDTGRSVSYPPGEPGYALSDLAKDAIGILDVLDVERAHIVGRSMSGAVALIAGIDYPDRVASLTFACGTTGDDDLPPMSDELLHDTADEPDLTDSAAVVEFIVGQLKRYAGRSPYFDADAIRRLAEEDVARTRNMASTLTNHFQIGIDGPSSGGFADISVPTLVVHGELDPVYPLPHGQAFQAAIPGSTLLILEQTGHDIPREHWDTFTTALIQHTTP